MNIQLSIEGDPRTETMQNVLIALAGGTQELKVSSREVPREAKETTAPENDTPAESVEEAEEAAKTKPSKAKAVDFETVRKAAIKAMNSGDRAEMQNRLGGIFKTHGGETLKDVAEDELPAVLEELEALL